MASPQMFVFVVCCGWGLQAVDWMLRQDHKQTSGKLVKRNQAQALQSRALRFLTQFQVYLNTR